ncbi:hypothetical protein DCC62_22945 [candidate division KSB1 bacterium]|nr:MAG: hypothetical protein DCC62_22945 [candidate division KSB1 bacterium]
MFFRLILSREFLCFATRSFISKFKGIKMNQQITITLSETALARANNLASVVAQPLERVLAETLELTLPDVGAEVLPQVSTLPDEEVLALTQAQMVSEQDTQLSELLEKQQAGLLGDEDRIMLHGLFQVYLRLWLRQSEALAEAVKRGLHEPLSPSA